VLPWLIPPGGLVGQDLGGRSTCRRKIYGIAPKNYSEKGTVGAVRFLGATSTMDDFWGVVGGLAKGTLPSMNPWAGLSSKIVCQKHRVKNTHLDSLLLYQH
jgi:hypothetical protein